MAERTPVIVGSASNARALPTGDTVAGLGRSLFSFNNDVANAGTTEETLYTTTLAANTFISNKGWIQYKYWGNFASNANLKALYVKFGPTLYVYKSNDIDEITSNAQHWKIEGSISRVSNTVLRSEGEIIFYGISTPSWFRYYELTGLDLGSTSYAMALRTVCDVAGDVTARGGWATYWPGI